MPGLAAAPAAVPRNRVVSLDLFRGITITAMILVNNPGNDAPYWPLKHADWNGWTPADLIFPFFLFIVGVSLDCSFHSRMERGASKSGLLLHSVRRSGIIFAIGLFLNAYPFFDPASLRIPGILQRIALASLAAAVLTLWFGRKGRLAAVIGLLFGYWVLLRFVPVPGHGMPGKDIPFLDPDGNLAAYLDRKLMLGHLFEGSRDPVGLLSTVPAVVTTLLGTLAGEWLRSDRDARRKVAWMLALGLVGLAAGKIFGGWFPLNRKLWTSSFVLFTGGAALVCLALCYWATDIRQWRGAWTRPFVVFGTNAIATYIFSELVWISGDSFLTQSGGQTVTWQASIFQYVFAPLGNPGFSSLLYSIAFMLICLFPIWTLYRKQILLKI
jgi:predicted acyltransferase